MRGNGPERALPFCPSIIAVIDSLVGPGLRTEQAGPTGDEGPITYLATLCISRRAQSPARAIRAARRLPPGRGRGSPSFLSALRDVTCLLSSDHGSMATGHIHPLTARDRQMNHTVAPAPKLLVQVGMQILG